MNKGKIRLLNSKSTDLDWNYSRHNQKLKYLVRDLLFMTFVKKTQVPIRLICLGKNSGRSKEVQLKDVHSKVFVVHTGVAE